MPFIGLGTNVMRKEDLLDQQVHINQEAPVEL